MNNSGFYKKDGFEILYAPNIVEGPNYTLITENKDSYEYLMDGWIWAESEEAAILFFKTVNPNDQLFNVEPETQSLSSIG
jgi:hypothetical protein